jgi:L-lactate dehydrogenase complex protein LldG
MTTRSEFLDRIRDEMRKTGGRFAAQPAARPAAPGDVADLVRRELAERWPETLERFRRELERVGGVFHRAARVTKVPPIVGGLARERGARRLVVWHATGVGADLAAGLSAEGLAVDVVSTGSDDAERQRMRTAAAVADLGVTGVDLAVAETGTLVLRSGPGRPRSTSLLPPCHIAVFDRAALVESLEQVGVFLEAWHAGAGEPAGAMINFITGPSRTADIELTLTRGVHGPKEVHAIFVEEPLGG